MLRTMLFSSALLFSMTMVSQTLAADGKTLFEENCASCHMPEAGATHDDLVAPPMFAVLRNYSMVYPDRTQAVNEIMAWILKPQEARSVMPGAVQEFGVMPPLEISQDDARAIAEYLTTARFDPPMIGRGGGMGQGMGQGMGKGMMHRQGQQ